jgi:hypothetical protein
MGHPDAKVLLASLFESAGASPNKMVPGIAE